MEVNRFRSKVKYLEYFKDYITVECPNCHKKAQMHRQLKDCGCCKGNDYKFECNHCYTEIKEVQKYIYTVNRYCPYCSEIIDYKSMPTTKIKKEQKVSCKGCKTNIVYVPKIEEVNEFIWKDNIIHFSFWYSQTYRGERFWALNEEHLDYLENFIRAKLRLRNEHHSGMMLVDKLPKFIKDKKNRDDLLKLISKLRKK